MMFGEKNILCFSFIVFCISSEAVVRIYPNNTFPQKNPVRNAINSLHKTNFHQTSLQPVPENQKKSGKKPGKKKGKMLEPEDDNDNNNNNGQSEVERKDWDVSPRRDSFASGVVLREPKISWSIPEQWFWAQTWSGCKTLAVCYGNRKGKSENKENEKEMLETKHVDNLTQEEKKVCLSFVCGYLVWSGRLCVGSVLQLVFGGWWAFSSFKELKFGVSPIVLAVCAVLMSLIGVCGVLSLGRLRPVLGRGQLVLRWVLALGTIAGFLLQLQVRFQAFSRIGKLDRKSGGIVCIEEISLDKCQKIAKEAAGVVAALTCTIFLLVQIPCLCCIHKRSGTFGLKAFKTKNVSDENNTANSITTRRKSSYLSSLSSFSSMSQILLRRWSSRVSAYDVPKRIEGRNNNISISSLYTCYTYKREEVKIPDCEGNNLSFLTYSSLTIFSKSLKRVFFGTAAVALGLFCYLFTVATLYAAQYKNVSCSQRWFVLGTLRLLPFLLGLSLSLTIVVVLTTFSVSHTILKFRWVCILALVISDLIGVFVCGLAWLSVQKEGTCEATANKFNSSAPAMLKAYSVLFGSQFVCSFARSCCLLKDPARALLAVINTVELAFYSLLARVLVLTCLTVVYGAINFASFTSAVFSFCLKKIWDWSKRLSKKIWDLSKKLSKKIWDLSKQLLEKIWDLSKQLLKKIWDLSKKLWEKIWDLSKKLSKKIWDLSKKLLENIKRLVNLFKGINTSKHPNSPSPPQTPPQNSQMSNKSKEDEKLNYLPPLGYKEAPKQLVPLPQIGNSGKRKLSIPTQNPPSSV